MEKTVSISGMHCHHCINAIRGALETVNGVSIRRVEIGTALISGSFDEQELRDKIQLEGYQVESID